MAGAPEMDPAAVELAAKIREIRERVRARYPENSAHGLPLPDLMPVLHARDAALAKVAAIGTVNPRPPGFVNQTVQFVKRSVARALDWHVREQVEFNRATIEALDATLEALNESNRALAEMARRLKETASEQAAEMADMRAHWIEWRVGWEQRLASTENEMLRTIAELKASFDFRATQVSEQIQRRLWADLDRVRTDYERLIHDELRTIRLRAAIPAAPPAAPVPTVSTPAPAPEMDNLRFSDRFRGTEEYVAARQQFYLPYFAGCVNVLDAGCGRGEFLEAMKAAGVPARGIELNAELVAICRAKGLDAEAADLFAYLPALEDGSLDGVFSAHVIEHLPPERLPEFLRTAARKLKPGGVLALETPNPECLAIFARHFYVDPTHVRPIPPALLNFYAEEAGFGRIEVHRLSPAVEAEESLRSLPEDFRNAFFGGQDYALTARRL